MPRKPGPLKPRSTVSSKGTAKTAPSFRLELEAFGQGAARVAGVDEAGRGPLAGPVVAAAVILPDGDSLTGLNDSKLLTAAQRDRLFDEIMEKALAVGVALSSVETIDRINILQASRLAMVHAVRSISPPPDYLLIDGPIRLDLEIAQKPVIKGDRLSASIAAGSIVAKVTRDRIMEELHREYPQYGFDRHKGYGVPAHRDAIRRHGPCPEHRASFAGVKDWAVQIELL